MITLKETLDYVQYYDTTGTTVQVSLDSVHPDLRDAVLRYGIKQILADAAAAGRGTPEADRMAKMARRAQALREGTWGLRPARSLVDEEVFVAAVAAGLIPRDDDALRAKWAGLGKKDRNAIRAMPAVAALLPVPEVGASILAAFGGVATEEASQFTTAAVDQMAELDPVSGPARRKARKGTDDSKLP